MIVITNIILSKVVIIAYYIDRKISVPFVIFLNLIKNWDWKEILDCSDLTIEQRGN